MKRARIVNRNGVKRVRRASSLNQKVNEVQGTYNNGLWIDKYKPMSESELAVNSKKVAQVKQWIKDSQILPDGGKLLFLTGPSGSGKSATLETLSRTMNIDLIRWECPDFLSNLNQENELGSSKIIGTGILYAFREFMRDACRSLTPSLVTNGSKNHFSSVRKLVVIDEIPNMSIPIIRKAVREEIKTYLLSKKSIVPLVIIVPEPTSTLGSGHVDNSRFYTLASFVGENFEHNSKVTVIKFLPVAISIIGSALRRILMLEFNSVNFEQLVKSILESSAQDIRSAINMLQFYCLTQDDTTDITSTVVLNSGVTQRDISKSIYSAVGNVLYRKFVGVNSNNDASTRLTIEDIIDSANTDSDTFMLFLHENYPRFFTNVKELAQAADYISVSDVINGNGIGCTNRNKIHVSVASHAVMHFNKTPAKSIYRKIQGPDLRKCMIKSRDMSAQLRSLLLLRKKCFPEFGYTLRPSVAISEILPTKIRLNNEGRISFPLKNASSYSPSFRSDPLESQLKNNIDEIEDSSDDQ